MYKIMYRIIIGMLKAYTAWNGRLGIFTYIGKGG